MLILLLVNTTALKRKNECLIFYPLVQLLTNKLLQPIEINTNQSIDNNNIDNIKINISRFSN